MSTAHLADGVTQPPDQLSEKPPSLWRHRDFLKLWIGQSLSMLGGQITLVAMPVIAVILLGAGPVEVGLLGGLGRAPLLLLLFVGVWADVVRRRPLVIGADLGRAALLLAIPVLYAVGELTIGWLYVIGTLLTFLLVVFMVAYQAYLPSLVGRDHLMAANGRLQLSESTAQLIGPSLGGLMVSAASAVTVLIADVVGLLASAVALLLIRTPEPAPAAGDRQPMFRAIGRGIRLVWRHPVLRPGALQLAVFFTFTTAFQVLLFLFLVDTLQLPPAWYGGILTAGGVGGLLGAAGSAYLIRRLGVGAALTWSVVLRGLVLLPIPFATGSRTVTVAMIVAAQLCYGVVVQVSQVSQAGLRQAATPDHMQGRTVATFRSVSLIFSPLAAVAAGAVADVAGLRATLAICAVGAALAVVPLLLSGIPRMRELPTPDDAKETADG